MAKSLVSIVIPVYNGSDYLRRAIDSALAQTYDAVEVIVVNDGSCDGGATESIMNSYGRRIRGISKTNGGVASALNAGLSHMRGEHFSWLSHDDEYLPRKIEAQLESLDRLGRADTVLYSDFQTIDSESRPLRTCILPAIDPDEFRLWITRENRLHGCTLLIHRSCFDRCGYFDPHLRTTQDYVLWFRMAKEFSFVRVPEVLVKARLHPNQGTRLMGSTALREGNSMLSTFLDELLTSELAPPMGPEERLRHLVAIARSFHSRGFEAAYRHACEKAVIDSRALGWGVQLYTRLRLSAAQRFWSWARRGLAKIQREISCVVWRARRKLESAERRFTKLFEEDGFGSGESHSGTGSTLEQTRVLRRELPKLIAELGVRSIVDAPCGDFNWMRATELGVESYVGLDVVGELIGRNNELYATGARSFVQKNIIEDDLPQADLLLCRDCLVHLTFKEALHAIRNFKRSGTRYLLMTTFTDRQQNEDLGPGQIWRALNMCLPPFSFPKPERLIIEGCTEAGGRFADKALGLWELESISL